MEREQGIYIPRVKDATVGEQLARLSEVLEPNLSATVQLRAYIVNLQTIATLGFENAFRRRIRGLNFQLVDVGGDCESSDQKQKEGYETHLHVLFD